MLKILTVLMLPFLLNGAYAWSADVKPEYGGTLIYGRGADSVSLEPGTSDDLESSKVIDNIYEGLVRTRDDSTEVEPSLAVSWEPSPDGLEWTFRLRQNVRFHDGAPLEADAVVYSFLRQIDPKHPGFRSHFKCALFTFQYVKSVEAVDRFTVRIVLERPYAPFLQNMAMVYARIVSPVAAVRWGDDFGKHPVGTGPFKFVEWTTDDRIVLQKNDDYWGEPPYLQNLVFKSILDNRDRLQALKTGAIHMMDGISPESAGEISRSGHLQLDVKPGLNVAYLAMNTEKKPFDQLGVRQAVNHAVNKQNLVKLLYRDMAIPAKNPMPPTMWGYAEEIKDYEYSLSRAKELLRESGYEQGFEADLWVMLTPRPYMPQPMELARLIKTNLASAGIKVNIVSHEWDAYLAKTANGEHDMCLLGWIGDNGDPDNFLYVLLDQDNAVKPKAENVSFWRNGDLHDLLVRAQQTADRQERTRLYIEAQKIIHNQAPWVPLAHVQQMIAFQVGIHGIVQHPFGCVRFQKVWKEQQ
jgi:peptide/nickel transport system substrate-binding protein